MKVREILKVFEQFAPGAYQESYDNSGLLVGNPNQEVNGALCTLDITPEVLDEAIETSCDLIVSHHPLIFHGLKQITGKTPTQQMVIKAIKKDIAIYAAHTNFDNIPMGVNNAIGKRLGLHQLKILSPVKGHLYKIVVFTPNDTTEMVRNAMFEAGAGRIGNYGSCSFNLKGAGTFKGDATTNPYVGQAGKLHIEQETRTETIVEKHNLNRVISAMLEAHPYEEVAYDVYALHNELSGIGAGMIGNLQKEMTQDEFLQHCSRAFQCLHFKYSGHLKAIKKVAFCGGSGSFLIGQAFSAKADVFITGDIKYHQFLDAPADKLLIDMGHYETEQFTPEIFYNLLIEKIPTFAVRLSEIVTNPIKYY